MVSFGNGKVGIRSATGSGWGRRWRATPGPGRFFEFLDQSLFGLVDGVGGKAPNLPSRSAASTRFSRCLLSTASASGIVSRARSTTGCCSANCPTRWFRLSVAAMMSPFWSLRYAVESVQLPYQASQIFLAAPERGAERLGDVL